MTNPIPLPYFPSDNKAYTTLLYANGPGFSSDRHDPRTADTSKLDYSNNSLYNSQGVVVELKGTEPMKLNTKINFYCKWYTNIMVITEMTKETQITLVKSKKYLSILCKKIIIFVKQKNPEKTCFMTKPKLQEPTGFYSRTSFCN